MIQGNRYNKKQIWVVTGLEPCDSPKCSLECPHIVWFSHWDVRINTIWLICASPNVCVSRFFFYHIFSLCVHYHHYPSLQTVIEIRSTFDSLHLLQIGCSYHISVSHVNLLPIKQATTLCVLQSISYSFASTISTCCSAWAWDHECHITAYDLSR